MLHTKAEAAGRLRVSTRTIERYIYQGLLEATKNPGSKGRIRISDQAINDFLTAQRINPPTP